METICLLTNRLMNDKLLLTEFLLFMDKSSSVYYRIYDLG